MEFHYVVIYNSNTKKWSVVADADAYMPDGNVWDEKRDAEGGYGWFAPFPDDDPEAYLIDERAYTMLHTLASIWPEVDHGNY